MKTIYIDVDGVINAVSGKAPKQNTGWLGEWKQESIAGYPILWSTELIDRLNALDAREDVEFIWLTTWRSLAPQVLSEAIGLNGQDWDYVDAPDEDLENLNHWWKLAAIRRKRKLRHVDVSKSVWIDDDIYYESAASAWVRDEWPNLLAISPNSYHGITRKQMESIEEFLI